MRLKISVFCLGVLTLFAIPKCLKAEDLSIINARTGVTTTSPHVNTYHYVEGLFIHDRWIPLDINEIDGGHNNYREYAVGGGYFFVKNKKVVLWQEVLYDWAVGPASNNAKYLLLWNRFNVQMIPNKLEATVFSFPIIPVNRNGHYSFVIERAVTRYHVNRWFTVGAGYAGSYTANVSPWNSRPFGLVGFTKGPHWMEFWLQKIPDGAQVQFRYNLMTKTRFFGLF